MKNENEMLELFQVEELEKRYEMCWMFCADVDVPVDVDIEESKE